MAIMKFNEALKSTGVETIRLAAGLPDHSVSEKVRDEMVIAANDEMAPYPKYDDRSKYYEETLKPAMAQFHNNNFDLDIAPDCFAYSAGSTPVIDATVTVALAGIPNSKLLTVTPTYPLYELPAKRGGREVDTTARLVTTLDTDDFGNPFQAGRWTYDFDSVRKALGNNRPNGTILVINEPGNPTGFAATFGEKTKLVEVLLEDIRARNEMGPETNHMLILEDIAYATMMHNGKKCFTLQNVIDHMKIECKESGNQEKMSLLEQLENNVLVCHSFSKAFGTAGHRVAYWYTKNEELYGSVYDLMLQRNLTPSISGLAALKGALDEGKVDEKVMAKYGRRVDTLEKGLNSAYKNIIEPIEDKLTFNFTKKNLPVRAKADGGFFVCAKFNFMEGMSVDKETIEKTNDVVKDIIHESSKEYFSNLFKDGKINNSFDAAIWLTLKAKVVAVPLKPGVEGGIDIRFSVGDTKNRFVNQAVENIDKAFKEAGIQNQIIKFYNETKGAQRS